MNAEFATRAHIYLEELEALRAKYAALAEAGGDDTCVRVIETTIPKLDENIRQFRLVAQRAIVLVRSEERQQHELIGRLEASISQRQCAEVANR
jgi:hypothetical protein